MVLPNSGFGAPKSDVELLDVAVAVVGAVVDPKRPVDEVGCCCCC